MAPALDPALQALNPQPRVPRAGGTISLYSLLCRELRVGFSYRTRPSEAGLSRASLSRHSLQRTGGAPPSPGRPAAGGWLRRKLEVRAPCEKLPVWCCQA